MIDNHYKDMIAEIENNASNIEQLKIIEELVFRLLMNNLDYCDENEISELYVMNLENIYKNICLTLEQEEILEECKAIAKEYCKQKGFEYIYTDLYSIGYKDKNGNLGKKYWKDLYIELGEKLG